MKIAAHTRAVVAMVVIVSATGAQAQEKETATTTPATEDWQFGAFVDAGYLNSLNSPSNHLFRSRGTTPRVDELALNIAGAYVRKKASSASRWGVELTGHAGRDSQLFGFSATAPNLPGADWLRRLGPTNVSYVAPIGSGLTVQSGIFSSFVGYDSLYAADNFTYTRPWTADFTPYLMLGVSAAYAVTERLTSTALVLNGYWHLARANSAPTIGAQLAYKASELVSLKQTMLYGSHQSNTSLQYWRVLSDTIVERRTDRVIAAFEFQISREVLDAPENPSALWVAGQAPVRWIVGGPWSVTVRPEFAFDRDGRWTTFQQTVRAITSTLEYRVALPSSSATLRLEHRYDDSRGPNGGFFKGAQTGAPGLAPGQHLLVIGLLLNAEASTRP